MLIHISCKILLRDKVHLDFKKIQCYPNNRKRRDLSETVLHLFLSLCCKMYASAIKTLFQMGHPFGEKQ